MKKTLEWFNGDGDFVAAFSSFQQGSYGIPFIWRIGEVGSKFLLDLTDGELLEEGMVDFEFDTLEEAPSFVEKTELRYRQEA